MQGSQGWRYKSKFNLPKLPEAAARRVELGRKAVEIRWQIEALEVQKLELAGLLAKAEQDAKQLRTKGIYHKGLNQEIEEGNLMVLRLEDRLKCEEDNLQRARARHRQLLGK